MKQITNNRLAFAGSVMGMAVLIARKIDKQMEEVPKGFFQERFIFNEDLGDPANRPPPPRPSSEPSYFSMRMEMLPLTYAPPCAPSEDNDNVVSCPAGAALPFDW